MQRRTRTNHSANTKTHYYNTISISYLYLYLSLSLYIYIYIYRKLGGAAVVHDLVGGGPQARLLGGLRPSPYAARSLVFRARKLPASRSQKGKQVPISVAQWLCRGECSTDVAPLASLHNDAVSQVI